MTSPTQCPLCLNPGGRIVWRNDAFRVIDPQDPDYPGLTRIIWSSHAAEMTDLSRTERDRLMNAVWTVEIAQRAALAPDKINVASLGNMVPHVHWHVIPRWRDDRHFPDSIWSPPHADLDHEEQAERVARLPGYWQALLGALSTLTS